MTVPHLSALLLVDGYNIIGTWPSLEKIRDRHGLAPARQELVETLIDYSAHKGFKTQIIFDAQYQKSPSSQEKYTPNLSVRYTAWKQTADTYIEKVCAGFYRQADPSPPRLIVATSDRAQQLTVLGYGAEWMSAQRLAQEVKVTAGSVKKKQRPHKSSQSRFLFNTLDVQVQQRLSQWRQGLP